MASALDYVGEEANVNAGFGDFGEQMLPSAGGGCEVAQQQDAAVEKRGEHVKGVEITHGRQAAEKLSASPAETGERGETERQGIGEAEGSADLHEVQDKRGALAGVLEELFDGGPIQAAVVALEHDQVPHGAEGGPDAVVVRMVDLGVEDEVGGEMYGAGNAGIQAVEVNRD